MQLRETSSLKPYGTATERYTASFKSLSHDFRLTLTGKTRSGNSFKRSSFGIIIPTTALIRIMSAPGGFEVKAGNRRGTSVLLVIHNFGQPEYFKIRVVDDKQFAQNLIVSRVYAIKGRRAVVPVRYVAPKNAKKGLTHKSVVIAEGEKSKVKTSIPILLLVM